jgi:ribonuclease HIII
MVSIPNQDESIINKLMEIGFHKAETKTEYEIARMVSLNPKAVAVLYKSKKLLIQASEDVQKKILMKLGLKLSETIKSEEKPRNITGLAVGSDETLKGDTFGGLVVAGVLCNEKQRQELKMCGIDDSKKIDDKKIPILADEIRRILPKENISIKNVYPEVYNNNTQTQLMNDLHKQVYLDIKKEGAIHIVDKYPGCNAGDICETKAESKYVEVAAASILAREAGLKQIDELSDKLGIDIPKGSTHVSDALEFLKKSEKNPKQFVKLHFKNVQKILK